MRYIILDLETVQHPDAHLWADPVKVDSRLSQPIQPDSRLKDPVKVAANQADVALRNAEREVELAAAIAEKESERALDPDCNRIVALGFHVVGGADPTCYLMRDEFEEREQLKLFWDIYRQGGATLVTFNGFKFDLPVLMRRSMYLDVPYPDLSLDRYRSPHIDLWQRLSYNGAISAHGLKFYAKRLGFTTLDKVDGGQIAQLVAEERWPEVEAHCLSDVGLTHALAARLGLLKLGVA